MKFHELDMHTQKILKGLVEFYLEFGYIDESYNDPERGGIYEHKLANKLGYELTPTDFPPPEFMAAVQILEAKGLVKRMKRNDEVPMLGIWPTPSGVLEYQAISKKNEKMDDSMTSADNTRVFVVHGRNEELRISMFEFLRSLGLNPIEWSQAIQMTGDAAPFIGEVLDVAFQQAQAVVVLLNGDDEARLRLEYHSDKMPDYEKNLTPQARPNVLFEAGLALGRFPKRTIIVEVGDLRPFSDIAGRHTIRLNNTTQTRQDVAQRLMSAGCKVDLSGRDWHQTGNFEYIKPIISQADELDKISLNQLSLSHTRILEQLTHGNFNILGISKNMELTQKVSLYLIEDLLEKNLVSKNNDDLKSAHFSLTKAGMDYLISIGKA